MNRIALVIAWLALFSANAAALLGLAGFTPKNASAKVIELAGPLDAKNSAEKPEAVAPTETQWKHGMKDGAAPRTFAAHSFTIIRFE